MKTIRLIGVLFSPFAVGSVFAQVAPDFISVDAQHVYVQTGASATAPATYSVGVSGPYAFVVGVEADSNNLSGNTAPTFTVPGGSTYSGSLTLAPNGTNWRSSNYYSSSPVTGDFPGGTYTVTQPGGSPHTISVNLADNLFPSAPVATIAGGSGTWSGSTLSVSPGTALTFSTGNFANWETNGAVFNHIGIFIGQSGSELATGESFSNGAAAYPTFFGSTTGQANNASAGWTFTSGQYLVEMEFNSISGVDTSGYPGAVGIALNTARTTFSIQVIPESSTYAVIFGAVACLGVAFRRRRALAGVMIHRHRRTA